jgi:hypothetical protein
VWLLHLLVIIPLASLPLYPNQVLDEEGEDMESEAEEEEEEEMEYEEGEDEEEVSCHTTAPASFVCRMCRAVHRARAGGNSWPSVST